mmetsp:Transcript_93541/g.263848  ORF Transcript_93541/g.263848 Transcript_93541/m.263848 type:complete len:207 (-) Transcript_93541:988-1608(-)
MKKWLGDPKPLRHKCDRPPRTAGRRAFKRHATQLAATHAAFNRCASPAKGLQGRNCSSPKVQMVLSEVLTERMFFFGVPPECGNTCATYCQGSSCCAMDTLCPAHRELAVIPIGSDKRLGDGPAGTPEVAAAFQLPPQPAPDQLPAQGPAQGLADIGPKPSSSLALAARPAPTSAHKAEPKYKSSQLVASGPVNACSAYSSSSSSF